MKDRLFQNYRFVRKTLRSFLRLLAYKSKLKQSPYNDRVVSIDGQGVRVGKYSYGFEGTKIYRWSEDCEIKIGRYCSIAYGLKLFCGGNHNKALITTFPFGKMFTEIFSHVSMESILLSNGNIIIGNDVWIGRDVTIMSGVTLGDGCIVAANSHVVKDIEPYSVYGGNPAKFIKYRFSTEYIEMLLRIKWWELDDDVVSEILIDLLNEPTIDVLIRLEKLKTLIKDFNSQMPI